MQLAHVEPPIVRSQVTSTAPPATASAHVAPADLPKSSGSLKQVVTSPESAHIPRQDSDQPVYTMYVFPHGVSPREAGSWRSSRPGRQAACAAGDAVHTRRKIVTPAAAVARRQARPPSVPTRRAAPRRRFRAYAATASGYAASASAWSAAGANHTSSGSRSSEVDQPAGRPDRWRGVGRQRFAGIAPAFVFFCRSSRSSRSGQCLQGIRWNVCRNVCRSSRSSGPFQSWRAGHQVPLPTPCSASARTG
jgi:hypothetical protein